MKRWIYERFLPMWAKQTLMKDLRLLRRENARLRQTLREKEAYIKGMHKGISRKRERIKMDNGQLTMDNEGVRFAHGIKNC